MCASACAQRRLLLTLPVACGWLALSLLAVGSWKRPISHFLISKALHAEGLSHKVLERLAKQRNEDLRAHCKEALHAMAEAGDLDDAIIIDESGQV